MAVHIPLTLEAQLEARCLMLSSNNILSPSNGEPTVVPSHDVILGLYYMTRERKDLSGEDYLFSNIQQVKIAYQQKMIALHQKIKVRIEEFDYDKEADEHTLVGRKVYDTTVGRALVWDIIPKGMSYEHVNKVLKKKQIAHLLAHSYAVLGTKKLWRFPIS